MRAAIVAFTARGVEVERRIASFLLARGDSVFCFVKCAALRDGRPADTEEITEPIGDWAGAWMRRADQLIFVGACGIAVRAVAAHLCDKTTDPGVIVVDAQASFCIPLLSGHLGGANRFACELAAHLGAQPVVTTATDACGLFAVDVFAKENGFLIGGMKLAKEVSAKILAGGRVRVGAGEGFFPEEPGWLAPAELSFAAKRAPDGMRGTFWLDAGDGRILHLIPQNMALGVGCRRGTDAEQIRGAVDAALENGKIFGSSIFCVASIDLKKDEAGLLSFARSLGVPFVTYSSRELCGAPGEYTASAFVKSVAGVDNVCERSAVLAAGGGELVIRKTVCGGVTVAVAVKKWGIAHE